MIISNSRILIFSILTCVFANASNNSNANRQAALNTYNSAQALIHALQKQQEPNLVLLQQAVSLWEEALRLDPGLPTIVKSIYRNLATSNFSLGQPNRAFRYYLLALENEGNEFPVNSYKHLAMNCMEITIAKHTNGDLEQSGQYNLLAKSFFEIFIAKNTEPFSISLCMDIANVYLSADEYENSLVWHQKASEIAKETKTALPGSYAASYSFLKKKLEN